MGVQQLIKIQFDSLPHDKVQLWLKKIKLEYILLLNQIRVTSLLM